MGPEWRAYTDRPFTQTRANKTPKFLLRLCAIEAYPALFLFFGHVAMFTESLVTGQRER